MRVASMDLDLGPLVNRRQQQRMGHGPSAGASDEAGFLHEDGEFQHMAGQQQQ